MALNKKSPESILNFFLFCGYVRLRRRGGDSPPEAGAPWAQNSRSKYANMLVQPFTTNARLQEIFPSACFRILNKLLCMNQKPWHAAFGKTAAPCIMLFQTILQIRSRSDIPLLKLFTPQDVNMIFHMALNKKSPESILSFFLFCGYVRLRRRGGDSNSRYSFTTVRRFSKPLPSATRPPLQENLKLEILNFELLGSAVFQVFNSKPKFHFVAEDEGLEPPSPCGRQFSRLLTYQLA